MWISIIYLKQDMACVMCMHTYVSTNNNRHFKNENTLMKLMPITVYGT